MVMIRDDILQMSFEEYLALIVDFTDGVLIPREMEMVQSGEVPGAVVAQMAEFGLFGITLPRSWGGLGWSVEQQVRLTMEFTRASCVYRSRFSTTIGLCSQMIMDYGTDAQKEQFLPAMAAGECIFAFALTEPMAGSDVSALATSAVRRGNGWILNGEKRFITNGAWADQLVVFAKVDDSDSTGAGGLSAFIVSADSEGIDRRLPATMNGHEAGPVAELSLSDVWVPDDSLLGDRTGSGLRFAMRGINHARTHVAATAVGQATRLLHEATLHTTTRSQFGQRLADFGTVEAMLGQSYAESQAGKALVLDCARAFDKGPIPRHQISAAKYFCTEMAFRVADRALQMLGGEGIVGDSAVPRMWRDVRALRIYEGASEIHLRNLGRFVVSGTAKGPALE